VLQGKATKKEREIMTKLSMEYMTNELKAFRKALKEGDLDTAENCLSHFEYQILGLLKRELEDTASEVLA
jgi:hypothetical protein